MSDNNEINDINDEPSASKAPAAEVGHGDDSSHGDHRGGLGHIASVGTLLGTFGALMVLTVLTVLATKVDFGSQMNLIIAMAIATVKAGLVCMFFMHLWYDKALHTVVFLAALLFALLYISIALMDGSQYQSDTDWVRQSSR